mmetsp:Transcript_49585/g.125996  ORF Transcript_49585/g.125996 Transcript_49585/m.125996 type:complete len:231 (-) Transcript_49585:583-1275(-)
MATPTTTPRSRPGSGVRTRRLPPRRGSLWPTGGSFRIWRCAARSSTWWSRGDWMQRSARSGKIAASRPVAWPPRPADSDPRSDSPSAPRSKSSCASRRLRPRATRPQRIPRSKCGCWRSEGTSAFSELRGMSWAAFCLGLCHVAKCFLPLTRYRSTRRSANSSACSGLLHLAQPPCRPLSWSTWSSGKGCPLGPRSTTSRTCRRWSPTLSGGLRPSTAACLPLCKRSGKF